MCLNLAVVGIVMALLVWYFFPRIKRAVDQYLEPDVKEVERLEKLELYLKEGRDAAKRAAYLRGEKVDGWLGQVRDEQ